MNWKDTENFKGAILMEYRLSVLKSDVFKKQEGKETWRKKDKEPIMWKLNLLEKYYKPQSYKKTKNGGAVPVQYLENIVLAIEKSDWLISAICPLK